MLIGGLGIKVGRGYSRWHQFAYKLVRKQKRLEMRGRLLLALLFVRVSRNSRKRFVIVLPEPTVGPPKLVRDSDGGCFFSRLFA